MKATRFITMYEDNDATYARRLDNRRYHVIHFIDLIEACGERDAEQMGGRYSVDLREIDLDLLTDKQVEDVLRFIGREDDKEMPDDWLAIEAVSYGYAAPLFDEIGNNREELLKNCRRESARLQEDKDAYEEAMDKPVNAMGSTAREFAQGDLRSAMVRGIQAGKPEARIVGKIHGIDEGVMDQIKEQQPFPITAMSVTLKKIPSDDPIAYMMGYQDALGGRGKPDAGDDKLAPAYLEGYKKGVAVKCGDEQFPDFHG